jgi:hypothetical protein
MPGNCAARPPIRVPVALDQAVAGHVEVEPRVGVVRVERLDERVDEGAVDPGVVEDGERLGELPGLQRLVPHVLPVEARRVGGEVDDVVAGAALVLGAQHAAVLARLRLRPWTTSGRPSRPPPIPPGHRRVDVRPHRAARSRTASWFHTARARKCWRRCGSP